MNRSVLAIFVKSPEFSPVKTRLAASIGQEKAVHFYELALSATAAVAREARRHLTDLDVVWAVAEKESLSLPRWNQFPTVFQGDGGLGERLHHVYESLLQKYATVSLIGADSPHIDIDRLVNALVCTRNHREVGFVLGTTDDGGFYYFGGGLSLSRETWTSVEYSSHSTAVDLSDGLEIIGPIEHLAKDFDIDVLEDLRRLSGLERRKIPEQIALIDWARKLE